LDPRVARGVEERATDDDDASGEEARARLEGRAADLERAVAADSAPPMDRERSAERGVIDLLVVTRRGLVDLAGALAHQRGVRRDVVVLREEGEQAHLYVVQASGRAEVIEASLAQRTPEALHLTARLRVVRRRVQQADAQPRARGREHLARVRRAVVEVERFGTAAP